MARHAAIFVALVAVGSTLVAPAVAGPGAESLGINWANVEVVTAATPTTLPSDTPPTGCECASGSAPCDPANVFECTCVCDLTAGACDANCCCDAECTDADKARFEQCDEEGPSSGNVVQCVDLSAESIAQFNPSERLKELESRSATDNMLCVVHDNNPSTGSYYSLPTITSAIDVPDATYIFGRGKRSAPPVAADRPLAYAVGTTLVAQYIVGETFTSVYPGTMALRSGGLGGVCADGATPVEFFESVEGTSCVHRVSAADTHADWCGAVSAESIVTNVRVAATPRADAYVSVTLGTTSKRTAGVVAPVAVTADDLSSSAAGRLDGDGCTCNFAVTDVAYHVETDAEANIVAITADVIFEDVSVCPAGSGGGVAQRWSVDFSGDVSSIEASAAAGNLMNRTKSGNPGYIFGRPLLGGVLESLDTGDGDVKRAVNMYSAGLTVRGPAAGGACAATSSGAVPYVVGFGEDVTFSCALTLSVADLNDRCDASLAVADIPFIGLYDTAPYVGIFGNADPYKSYEWLAVDRAESNVGPDCPTMVTGFDVTVVWGYVGERSNPQPRVVDVSTKARTEYVPQEGDDADTRTVYFQTTITFQRVAEGDLVDFVPPAPPLLPELPNDLFFPFKIAGDATATVDAAAPVAGGAGAARVALVALAAAIVALSSWAAAARA